MSGGISTDNVLPGEGSGLSASEVLVASLFPLLASAVSRETKR